ncbi:hypothetical protein L3Q82_016584 [Scortum barcoo]|uniref:Uncharacterized protein n=1 Tax=Scortum barcoo TaxID=214431 RepID=A0ACB8X6X5_9TELE|nr:hypothetical protein L3Q82_016584 [Scortum barcoo]
MDGGGDKQRNEERGAEKLMDAHLKSLGLLRKKIAKDGSCLFRAVAEQTRINCVNVSRIKDNIKDKVLHCQSLHTEVRSRCVDFLKQNRESYEAFIEGDFEDYLYKLQDPQQWVGEVEINALAVMYKRDFLIYQEPGKPAVPITDNNFKEKDRKRNELDGSETKQPELPGPWKRGQRLPNERVKRSLNPTLYRNIEYDVWQKTKRAQHKLDYSIAAGMQFTAGDRCQVCSCRQGRNYNATIKEVMANNGPVTVFIEELGKKQVPLWMLQPANSENSWSTVVNRDKRVSNGHGEWEERGKGRGRGKHIAASSSVSQATAAGSTGRVQKQHSWPQQATVEEPGGTKASRKSMSSVVSTFCLTEEQRLAKEEEERNVALVEIQLRDEHSFPALGAQSGIQSDGGKKKGGEKRRSQRNKTKSPVEDVRAASPSAAEQPKSSTPPPAAPPANSESDPARPGSLKAATPATNAAALTSSSAPPPVCAKTSYASAAGAAPSSPPTAVTKPSPPLFSFITPVLPSASSPPTPHALPSSSSSVAPKPSSSPPPSSSLPAPTFIAPIAPSPAAAQGFLPRSSSPVSTLPHSPSPPFHLLLSPPSCCSRGSSSFNFNCRLTRLHVFSLSLDSLPNTGATLMEKIQSQVPQNQNQISVPQTQTQASPAQGENQTQNQILTQAETQPPLPQSGLLQSHTEVTSASQIQPHVLQTAPPQVQSSHMAPGASHPLTSQASGPISGSVPPQPPHPSQVPHPSLSLAASSTPPSHQSQTEASLPPAQPGSPPAHAAPHQSLPAHPLLPPPHPQSIPGAVPVQQLSQLFQDPLYPGFPQSDKGDMAPVPPYSSSKSGDDLPRGLHHAHVPALHVPLSPPAGPRCNPSSLPAPSHLPPHYPPPILPHATHYHPSNPATPPFTHHPPSNPPTRHQEAYQPPQFPPTSLPPQFDHQARLPEPPHPSDPSFIQAGYPVTQPPPRMPLAWQQHPMPPPRNTSFPVGYPTSGRPYPPVPPPSSQGYHLTQGPGHPMYPPYPPSSLGYQPSSGPEELQVSQAVMEQRQPANRDSMSGQGPGRVPALLESPAIAANANNNRTLAPGVALKKDQGDSLTREVLLVDPPLNNIPILISNPVAKDVSVSMATMKSSSTPGSQSPYDRNSKMTIAGDNNPPPHILRGPRQPLNPAGTYISLDPVQVSYLPGVSMPEGLSVGCNTEEGWEEPMGFKPATSNHRGAGKYRGGRGVRGRGHDPGRGAQRGGGMEESSCSWSYRDRTALSKGPRTPYTHGALPTEYHEGHGRMPSPDPQSTCGLVGQTPINPQAPCGGLSTCDLYNKKKSLKPPVRPLI